jgi:hypothetical protein
MFPDSSRRIVRHCGALCGEVREIITPHSGKLCKEASDDAGKKRRAKNFLEYQKNKKDSSLER